MFREMQGDHRAVPELDARVNIIKHFKRIEVLAGVGAGSTYEAMAGDAKRGHGLAPSSGATMSSAGCGTGSCWTR